MSLFILSLIAIVSRVIPHFPNVTALGATAVMAGRGMRRSHAIALLLATMLISDFLLHQIHGYPFIAFVTPFVYGGLIVQLLLSYSMRNRKAGAFIAAIGGSFLFFVISNFGVWLGGTLYRNDPHGLIQCYILALPFLTYSLVGDVLWTAAFTVALKAYKEVRLAVNQTLYA